MQCPQYSLHYMFFIFKLEEINMMLIKLNYFVVWLLSDLFPELLHHHPQKIFSQLCGASPLPLCTALWKNRLHQQQTQKSKLVRVHS